MHITVGQCSQCEVVSTMHSMYIYVHMQLHHCALHSSHQHSLMYFSIVSMLYAYTYSKYVN